MPKSIYPPTHCPVCHRLLDCCVCPLPWDLDELNEYHDGDNQEAADREEEEAEEEAAAELRRITPSNAELLKLAERFPAPQEWYDE